MRWESPIVLAGSIHCVFPYVTLFGQNFEWQSLILTVHLTVFDVIIVASGFLTECLCGIVKKWDATAYISTTAFLILNNQLIYSARKVIEYFRYVLNSKFHYTLIAGVAMICSTIFLKARVAKPTEGSFISLKLCVSQTKMYKMKGIEYMNISTIHLVTKPVNLLSFISKELVNSNKFIYTK